MILKGKFVRLICDFKDYKCSGNAQDYTGNTYKECIKEAKFNGWEIKGVKVLCPYHASKKTN